MKSFVVLLTFFSFHLMAADLLIIDGKSHLDPADKSKSHLELRLENTGEKALMLTPSSMSLISGGKKVGYHFDVARQLDYAAKELVYWENQLKSMDKLSETEAVIYAKKRLAYYSENPLKAYQEYCQEKLSLSKSLYQSVKLYQESYRLAPAKTVVFYLTLNTASLKDLKFVIDYAGTRQEKLIAP